MYSLIYYLGNISVTSDADSHSENKSRRGSIISTTNSFKDGFPIYSIGDHIQFRYEITKFIS